MQVEDEENEEDIGLLFIGPYVHSLTPEKITVVENGLIAVLNGKIVAVEKIEGEIGEEGVIEAVTRSWKKRPAVVRLDGTRGQFLCPGFVDIHVHAPQFPNIGLGYDLPLLQWLQEYTFPLEEKYADPQFAKNIYGKVVERTLSGGTTTASYFGTIHLESCLELAKAVVGRGQRALVGKVNMNVRCPANYSETTDASIEQTVRFIEAVKQLNSPLVKPIITPRFALTCDLPLMCSLAKLAEKYDLHIQTHVSENKDEVGFVKETYPDSENYSDVYDKVGLLTKKTILAHGVYLTDKELEVLSKRGTAIAHCPNSNTSIQSGLCDIRKFMKYGLKIGLGTDVSAGYSSTILNCMRSAIDTSIHLSFFNGKGYKPVTYHEAFYLATLGGAKAISMDDQIGNFVIGKEFDALLVDLECQNSPVDIFERISIGELVQKFIFVGDDRNIKHVYVRGRLVKKNGP